jgi:signal transduction histidine kinase
LEFHGVKSELAVPLRFSNRVIGVLDINSNKKDWFDDRKANLVQTLADQVGALYQNARIVESLYGLIAPFDLFASPEEIYDRVIRFIEHWLRTETVTVWEKQTSTDSPTFKLVASSQILQRRFQEANISTLPQDSLVGEVFRGHVVEANKKTLNGLFATKIAKENNLASMTGIPIIVGDECRGAIAVFSRRDTKLLREEITILRILASKAALALTNATLLQSFQKVASVSPGEDISTVLEGITSTARTLLRADPVILFRYEPYTSSFDEQPIVVGTLRYPKNRVVTSENHMANMILRQSESVYLRNEQDYLAFSRATARSWQSDRFADDFWHREEIRSLAAIKLEHAGETLGVMFINYREPKAFSEAEMRLIDLFASQTASIIYDSRLWEQNSRFWETRRADSLSLSVNELTSGLAHDAGALLALISMQFAKVDIYLRKEGESLERRKVEPILEAMRSPLNELNEDFQRLKDFGRLDVFHERACRVEELIDQALAMLAPKLERQRIVVKKRLRMTPQIQCDKNQIQHLLLNLLINALDAMGTKGTLSIETDLDNRGFVCVKVSDTGKGIPASLRGKIFEPRFSTKKQSGGSGMGLPVSRYIAAAHGGHIEFTTTVNKGTTFLLFLPVESTKHV